MQSIISVLKTAIQNTSKTFVNKSGETVKTTAQQRQDACKTIAETLTLPKRRKGELVAIQIERLVSEATKWISEHEADLKAEEALPEFKELKQTLFDEIQARSLSWLNFHMFNIEHVKDGHILKANFHMCKNGDWLEEVESINLLQSKNLAALEDLRVKFIEYTKGYLCLENEIDGQYRICFRTGPSTYTIRSHDGFIPCEQVVRSGNTTPEIMATSANQIRKLKVVK